MMFKNPRPGLLPELKFAVAQERACQMRVLELLKEVEDSKLYLEIGFSSLFEFTTRELGYSSSAAFRRVEAMRLLKTLPELKPKMEDGSLSLSTAAKAQEAIRKDAKRRRVQKQAGLLPQEKKAVVESLFNTSSREAERKLAEAFPENEKPQEKIKPLAHQQTLIQFVASAELMQKLEKLKGLMAHQNFEGRMDRLVELMAEYTLKRLDPELKPVRANGPQSKALDQFQRSMPVHSAARCESSSPISLPTLEVTARQERGSSKSRPQLDSRYIPAAIRRQVWTRDQGQCTYLNAVSGRRCSSAHGLQFDHVIPHFWGGPTVFENLRLRCPAHNRFTAIQQGLVRAPKAS